jgi:hypothetical protein
MLDLIGTTFLTAAMAASFYATLATMPLSPVQKLTTVTMAGLWIGLVIALAAIGLYAATAAPMPVVGVVAGLPLVGVAFAALFSARMREALLAVPVTLLVGLHILRVVDGGFILLLEQQGRLSGPFPESAGRGDILVGLIAIPLTIAIARGLSGSRAALLAWNILGTLDLVTAVWLGITSAPGSPLQMFGGTVGSTAMWTLPWSTIPTLMVPFYLITHGIIFARLARADRLAVA